MFHSPRLDLSSLNIENLSDEEWLKLRKSPSTDGRTFTDIISDLYKDGLRDVDSVIKTFNQREYQRDDLNRIGASKQLRRSRLVEVRKDRDWPFVATKC
jgi:hypothetical protein